MKAWVINGWKRQWTVKEAADWLNCAPGTLYRMAWAGAIPCYRVGSTYRFDPDTLIKWTETESAKRVK